MDYLYTTLFCVLLLGVLALTVALSGYLLFRLVDRRLRRCPNCDRAAAGTIVESQVKTLGTFIDRSGNNPVRIKQEKVTDHYRCDHCAHTWTHSFERKERAPVQGAPPT